MSLYLDGNEAAQNLQGIRHTYFQLMIRNQLDPSRSVMKGKASGCSPSHQPHALWVHAAGCNRATRTGWATPVVLGSWDLP